MAPEPQRPKNVLHHLSAPGHFFRVLPNLLGHPFHHPLVDSSANHSMARGGALSLERTLRASRPIQIMNHRFAFALGAGSSVQQLARRANIPIGLCLIPESRFGKHGDPSFAFAAGSSLPRHERLDVLHLTDDSLYRPPLAVALPAVVSWPPPPYRLIAPITGRGHYLLSHD